MITSTTWPAVVMTADFVIEISEWGIDRLGGVDFDTLTTSDIEKLDQFIKTENVYIKE